MEGCLSYHEYAVLDGPAINLRDFPHGRITHHPWRRAQRLWRNRKPPVRWFGPMREHARAVLKKTSRVGEIGRYQRINFMVTRAED